MKIYIYGAPPGAVFESEKLYTVYGIDGKAAFVFDENAEPVFLSDIQYEVLQ